MNRLTRIVLNIFAPPLIACLYLAIGIVIRTGYLEGHVFTAIIVLSIYLPFFAIFAYFVALAPCALHGLAMEIAYWRLPPHTWHAVAVSALSGLCFGSMIDCFFWPKDLRLVNYIWLLNPPALGMLVGFTLGWIVKHRSHPPIKPQPVFSACYLRF